MKLDVGLLSLGNILIFGSTKCRDWNILRCLSFLFTRLNVYMAR